MFLSLLVDLIEKNIDVTKLVLDLFIPHLPVLESSPLVVIDSIASVLSPVLGMRGKLAQVVVQIFKKLVPNEIKCPSW